MSPISCANGASATALAYLFPRDAAALNQRAAEAAESRIWAGIHYRSDVDAGLALGRSVSATISGANINQKTYFDLRFRRPGSTTDEIGPNWQQGTSASHSMSLGTSTGSWMITGVRSHQVINEFSGDFAPVSLVLDVVPR